MSPSSSLELKLKWLPSNEDTIRLTTAELAVFVDGEVVWPTPGEPNIRLEIQADDLLSYLTEFWKPLILRQTYPISVRPERPSLLRDEAEKRWETQPPPVVEREEERVAAFEEAHDLSCSFAGLFGLPPLWLLRSGEQMIVETTTSHFVPFDAACKALTDAGDEIANRLGASKDEHWVDLVKSWRGRDHGDPTVLLAWTSSLDNVIAKSLLDEGALSAPLSVSEAANDNDELRIAARMVSALPHEQIRQVVALVRGFPKKSADELNKVSEPLQAYIAQRFANRRAHEQGEAAANWLRERRQRAPLEPIDIFSLVEDLGVQLHVSSVEPPTLDGLAVWGDRHGPAVLLNEKSVRVAGRGELRSRGAARVTLAHELCHLLVDRGHAMTAVDILNSRMPLNVERRAKAFAGELLLPARTAAELWKETPKSKSLDGLKQLLDRLCKNYGVTQSVAAWKLEHGLHRLDIDISVLLDAIVPQR